MKYLYENPEDSRRLKAELHKQIQEDQKALYLEHIRTALRDEGKFRMELEDEVLVLTPGDLNPDIRENGTSLILQSKPQVEARQVKLTMLDKRGNVKQVKEAMEMRLRVAPHWEMEDKETEPTMDVTIEGFDVVIQTEEEQSKHKKFGQPILGLPMPADVAALRHNTVSHYLDNGLVKSAALSELGISRIKLLAKLQAEIHGRASFAISCLVLVMVGCALGMLFRSSNFLSAFAVSFIPAMFSVALIVTGQQVCSHARNSAALGLTFIWGGNALVLLLAAGLIGKLQRT